MILSILNSRPLSRRHRRRRRIFFRLAAAAEKIIRLTDRRRICASAAAAEKYSAYSAKSCYFCRQYSVKALVVVVIYCFYTVTLNKLDSP